MVEPDCVNYTSRPQRIWTSKSVFLIRKTVREILERLLIAIDGAPLTLSGGATDVRTERVLVKSAVGQNFKAARIGHVYIQDCATVRSNSQRACWKFDSTVKDEPS